MTTQTNAQVVAELYWTIKAIKEATGVTSKCWRPPQGDVDDRVRSIAWQMGLSTILWDEDTDDWNMPAPGGGNLSPKKVDAKFQNWIDNYTSGKDKHGHIVLEHELNSATVNMSMHWMPKLQEVFNVVPALACNGITQPYWETQFVYPTENVDNPVPTQTATTAAPTTTAPTDPATCTWGWFGLGQGNGYNGACCQDQADCWDDCIAGTCNGPVNPNDAITTGTDSAAVPTETPAACTWGWFGLGQGNGYNGACCQDQADCVDDCIAGTCNGPTGPGSATTTTTSKPATASCIPGARGKKRGNGADDYCCSSSDDCLETCRKGKCGL
jgi:hypothetical protein